MSTGLLDGINKGSSHPLEEPRLTACLSLARAHIAYSSPPKRYDTDLAELPSTVWTRLGMALCPFLAMSHYKQHFAFPNSNPLRRFATYFRAILVCETLISHMTIRPEFETLRDLELSLERSQKQAVKLGDLDEYTKQQVEGARLRFEETLKDIKGNLRIGIRAG